MKRFIPTGPDQPLLLPPDLRSARPEDHAVLLIADLGDSSDLLEVTSGMPDGSLDQVHRGGQPGFHPRVMVGIGPYASTQGMRSSRDVQRVLVENTAFRVVAHDQTPGFWALNRFRTQHREALGTLLEPTVTLAAGMALVNLGSVAVQQEAERYGWMDREEAWLTEEIDAYLKRPVDAYLAGFVERDVKDDLAFGPDHDGFSLPEEPRDTQARRNAIASAKRELEARAVAKKQGEHEARWEAAAENGKTSTPRVRAEAAQPEDRDPINVTDPESRIMVGDGAFVQAFDAHIAVDAKKPIVLAAQASNDAAGVNDLPSVLGEVMETTADVPGVVTADVGYDRAKNVEDVTSLDAEAWIPPDEVWR